MVEKFFENKTVLKVFAFLLSLLLWLFVNSTGDNQVRVDPPNTFLNLPVSWQNLDNDLVVTQPPDNVDVVIRGDSGLLDEITPQDLVLYVDLAGKAPGTHIIPVTGTSPRGTTIISINPDRVEVEIDEVISLQMQIDVEVRGAPQEGFVVGTPEVDPDQVFVRGPRGQVQKVARLFTSVDVSEADSHIHLTVVPDIRDYNGRSVPRVTIIPEMVDITIPIIVPEKEVPVNVQLLGEPMEGYSVGEIKVTPSNVRISGLREKLDELLSLQTEPLDISQADGDISTELTLIVPENVLSDTDIVSVTVQIVQDD